MSSRRGGRRGSGFGLAARVAARLTWKVAAVLVALAATLPLAASAQQRELRADRMDVDITVLPSGAVMVQERITYSFAGTWNGVFRAIPIRYDGPGGFDYSLDVDLRGVSIVGEADEPRVETDRSGGEVRWKVWVPDATDTQRTVVFDYRVGNGLRFFEDHDELYWNVIGDDSDVAFGPVEARVLLPAGATGIRTRAFAGGYGAREESVLIDVGPEYIEFDSDEDLGWRRGMSIVVGWDPGLVTRPTALDRALAGLSRRSAGSGNLLCRPPCG